MKKLSIFLFAVIAATVLFTLTSMTMDKKKVTGAYLEITLDIAADNRMNAGGVYVKYKNPFLDQIEGATSKDLLLRDEDVQVLHGFETEAQAKAYLSTALFENDVVRELKPYLLSTPEIRVYTVFKQ